MTLKSERDEIERQACVNLATAVIEKAVKDWHRRKGLVRKRVVSESEDDGWVVRAYREAYRNDYDTPREELAEFFKSGWFEFLLAAVSGLEADSVRKELGI